MDETKTNEISSGENKLEENKTPPENSTIPPTPEHITSNADDKPGEQPPLEPSEQKQKNNKPPIEAPTADTPTTPDIADGDVVIPSNVIDGLFDGKKAAVKEAEKQAAEQGKEEAGPSAPKRRGRPPATDKSKQAAQPPKTPKQAASVGGAAGANSKTGQTADKAKIPPVPAVSEAATKTPPENTSPPLPPEPPRNAARINETETTKRTRLKNS